MSNNPSILGELSHTYTHTHTHAHKMIQPKEFKRSLNKKTERKSWTSLVVQWLRIHLPMQGTRVWALVQEDPTCRRATKPVCHNYWACALEPTCHNYWAHVPQLLSLLSRAREPQLLSPSATSTEACAPRGCAPPQEVTTMKSPRTAMKSSPRSPQLDSPRSNKEPTY